MSTELSTRPKQELANTAADWSQRAADVRVSDAASCERASHLLKSIKSVRHEIAAWFAPHIDAAMETKRRAEAARKGLVDEKDHMEAPLVEAENRVKRALLAWETEQETQRREHERQLQAEAQRQAEALVLEATADLERQAAVTGDSAMRQEAEDLLQQPIEAPVVAVVSTMPKVAGVVYRDNWKAHPEIDLKALAGAVASGQVSVSFILANVTALHSFAKATEGAQAVPGVKFWNDRQIAARR